MTPQQSKILRLLAEAERAGRPTPSCQELAEGIGLSPRSKSTVTRHLDALEAQGCVRRDGYRQIAVLRSPWAPDTALQAERDRCVALLYQYAGRNGSPLWAIMLAKAIREGTAPADSPVTSHK